MGAIKHLTIALSAENASRIRVRMASGDYVDEDAVIEDALAALDAIDSKIAAPPSPLDDNDAETEAWMRAEVVAALEEYDRDPSRGISGEQLLAELASDRASHRQPG